jgi:hypothetical protein
MVDISESELTLIENAFVRVREALGEDESPEAMQIKEAIIEAEQIVSGLIDKEQNPDTLSGPTGGAAVNPFPPAEGQMPSEAESVGEISVEDVQALQEHLQEAQAIISKLLGKPMGAMSWEECIAGPGARADDAQALCGYMRAQGYI